MFLLPQVEKQVTEMIATDAGNDASRCTETCRSNRDRRYIATKALQILLIERRGLIELDQRLAQGQNLGPLCWRKARHTRCYFSD